jgi:hypothetical protein
MSSLAWIDFDEAERQRARRLMALFNEKESRDELGLGPVRDSIADHLFPGTSTIQTRLRYMLFVPWLCKMVEDREGSADKLLSEARNLEIRLIDALKAGEESEGVIGQDAGAALKRLPSSIYWAGLQSWGIRTFSGSQDSYFASLPALRRFRYESRHFEDAAVRIEGRPVANWHMDLPPPPPDLLKQTTFKLTQEEADFVVDRLVNSQPDSLLTLLAKNRWHAECSYVWEHPHFASFPDKTQSLIRNGAIFSLVMQGAALLYNLMLSELRKNEQWIAQYRRKLSEWADDPDLPLIASWQLSDFWPLVQHPAHRLGEPTRRFIQEWLELVRGFASEIAHRAEGRILVEARETRLKGPQSRFRNESALNRWGGQSGTRRLTFRWAEASGYVKDIADAG